MKPSRYLILAVVPVTVAAHFLMPGHQTVLFALACASMIPLARLLSNTTEQLAQRTGPTLGALLNVTFGNAGELVIGFFALRGGLSRVVKASITGSILVNLLLTLGVSMIVGGIRHKTLTFNPLGARTQSTMLALAAIALIFPAAYHFLVGPSSAPRESDLSLEFAVILLITYALSLVFTLYTHRELLAPRRIEPDHSKTLWTVPISLSLLAVSAALIAWIGEILVTSLQPAARIFGVSDFFMGLVVVAVAGNAAESTSAIRAAIQNRMDLAVGIAAGSSIQIALFVAPALIIASHWIAPHPIDLVFTPVELVAVVMAIAITTQVAGDGDSNWLEGVQLVVVYLLIAAMVFSLPPQAPTSVP
jgi:Ca2+:H+ antiporter